MTTIDIHFVQGLTLAERAALVTGADFWYTAQVPGVERVMFADGPAAITARGISMTRRCRR